VFRAWELSPDGYATLPMRGRTTRMFAKLVHNQFRIVSQAPRVNGLIAITQSRHQTAVAQKRQRRKLRVNHMMR
jgi:hypothetical protein